MENKTSESLETEYLRRYCDQLTTCIDEVLDADPPVPEFVPSDGVLVRVAARDD